MKADVGCSKPSSYDLPPETFRYGNPLKKDVEGAKESRLILRTNLN
jgi:hypothetical protein